MTVCACASTTPAAATARSRLSVCARTMSSDSSGLPNCSHQSSFGQTESRPASCPTNDCGRTCGVSAWGTWVAQPTSRADQATRPQRRCCDLLIPQRAYGCRAGHPYGVVKDREPGDRQRRGTGGQEVKRVQGNAVGEAVQPGTQVVPGKRPGDEVGDQCRNRKLPQQQQHDVAGAASKHLADTDFLGAAAGGEGRQTEQAEAGDEYGDADENAKHLTLPFVVAVEALETVIQEVPVHGRDGREGVPGLIDEIQGLRDHAGTQTH